MTKIVSIERLKEICSTEKIGFTGENLNINDVEIDDINTRFQALKSLKNCKSIFLSLLDDIFFESIEKDTVYGIYNERTKLFKYFTNRNMYVLANYIEGYIESKYDNCHYNVIRSFLVLNGCEIEYLWIHPEDRNKGLGKKIVEYITSKCTYIVKNVTSVPESVEFWKKMGFNVTISR